MYGFPLDLTKEILEEKGMNVDEDSFNNNMQEQRNRARKAREEGDSGWSTGNDQDIFEGLDTIFKGYEKTNITSEITGIFIDNEKVLELGSDEEGIIVLNESPFYGESGGQVGDTGVIENSDFKAIVLDTKHTKGDHLIHIVKIVKGTAKVGEKVIASVD